MNVEYPKTYLDCMEQSGKGFINFLNGSFENRETCWSSQLGGSIKSMHWTARPCRSATPGAVGASQGFVWLMSGENG